MTYTFEICKEIAFKYKYRSDFKIGNNRAYVISRKNMWLNEICSHMSRKPLPKNWTKELCNKISKKYLYRGEFKKNDKNCYQASIKNGWLNEICSHMLEKKKPNGYWTKEKCHEVALKYKYVSDLQKENPTIYTRATRKNWIEDICSHMIRKPLIKKWTKEKCHNIALKYKSRNEFKINDENIYTAARTYGWINDICSHMILKRKTYTYDECKEYALKYEYKTDFYENEQIVYRCAYKNNWLKEICFHMIHVGNLYKRCIYVFEFEDKHAYVGLTYNIKKRELEHMAKGVIKEYIINNNCRYVLKQLTDYVDSNYSKILELKYMNEYKENGWILINKVIHSTLGGGIVWSNVDINFLLENYEINGIEYCSSILKRSIKSIKSKFRKLKLNL